MGSVVEAIVEDTAAEAREIWRGVISDMEGWNKTKIIEPHCTHDFTFLHALESF